MSFAAGAVRGVKSPPSSQRQPPGAPSAERTTRGPTIGTPSRDAGPSGAMRLFFVSINYLYATTCGPKGHGSGSAAALRQTVVVIYTPSFKPHFPSPTGATCRNPQATAPVQKSW